MSWCSAYKTTRATIQESGFFTAPPLSHERQGPGKPLIQLLVGVLGEEPVWMSWRWTAFVAFFSWVALGCVSDASAQTTATLSGLVRDSSGAALPGVAVTARNVDTELIRSDVTGAGGRFTLALLPPGEYQIRAELSGFKPYVRRNLQLTIGQTLALEVTLDIGSLSEEVTVS